MSRRPYIKELPRAYRDEYDAQIAANEPVIEWAKNRHGIFVAVKVHDPHRDCGQNKTKDACIRGHKFTEANTIIRRDGRQCRTCKNEDRKPLTPEQKQRALELKRLRRRMREEAAEVAERFRKHRADNSPLMAAARTEI
jgi:hypothetical protein